MFWKIHLINSLRMDNKSEAKTTHECSSLLLIKFYIIFSSYLFDLTKTFTHFDLY
jgi:hypothetical protein